MMNNLFSRSRAALAVGLAVVGVACADRTGLVGPEAAEFNEVQARLAISTSGAGVGDRVAIALEQEGASGSLNGIRAHINYDPSALRFVGQSQERGRWVVANEEGTRLDVAALSVDPLPPSVGTFVFEVLRTDYTSAIRLEVVEAVATRGNEATEVAFAVAPVRFGGVAVDAAARKWSATDIQMAAYEEDLAAGRRVSKPGSVQYRPGLSYAGLRYGDVTLDNPSTVSLIDATQTLNIVVGLSELIIGTNVGSGTPTSQGRDYVVAGNVAPRLAGRPIGVEANGNREIALNDALDIINEVAGLNPPVVGDVMRAAAATDTVTVSANITANRTFFRDSIYKLTTNVTVTNGATLTIQPGTVVAGTTTGALVVARDGRIIADGTAAEPILMTCTGAKVKGCWGGLFVAGNAPTNYQNPALLTTFPDSVTSPLIPGRTSAGCLVNQGEGNAPLFGGCNPEDSSGVIRFVRSEWGGRVIFANNELNGITLSGVGRRTVVENIQVHGGLDDGLELFGGTVDVRNVVLTDNSDDSFDFAEGWAGRAQFMLIQMDPADGDKGFEIDNMPSTYTGTGGFNFAEPWGTIGDVSNVTIIGESAADRAANTGSNGINDALNTRLGVKARFRNLLVWGFRIGIDFDNVETCAVEAGNGAEFVLSHSFFGDVDDFGNNDADSYTCRGRAGGTDLEERLFITPANITAADSAIGFAIRNTYSNAAADSPWQAGVNPFSKLENTAYDLRPTESWVSNFPGVAPATRSLSLVRNGASNLGDGVVSAYTTWTRPEFMNTGASFRGALSRGLAGNQVPFYSGWIRQGW